MVYNEPYITYGDSVPYRSYGAVVAAKFGAVASLVRSVTPHSIYSPHTGWQDYDNSISSVQIPSACITVEDAEMFKRMQDQGRTHQVIIQVSSVLKPLHFFFLYFHMLKRG